MNELFDMLTYYDMFDFVVLKLTYEEHSKATVMGYCQQEDSCRLNAVYVIYIL